MNTRINYLIQKRLSGQPLTAAERDTIKPPKARKLIKITPKFTPEQIYYENEWPDTRNVLRVYGPFASCSEASEFCEAYRINEGQSLTPTHVFSPKPIMDQWDEEDKHQTQLQQLAKKTAKDFGFQKGKHHERS